MTCLLLKNLRFCQDGQFSALWNVNDSTVQMTTPDMLIGFQAQFITLSGVYTMEMNRFDSFTHYRNWAPEHPPSVHQRKLLRKYLYFVLSQWPEEDVQGPFPSQTGNPSTSSQPIINQIPASGMNIKTATLRQILVDHGQNAAPGQHVSPDHPPRTNNLLTVNSPHSLHPGSIYAAPPPPLQLIQVPQSGPQAIHLNLQWRIQDFPRGGANSQKCYYFSIFCQKLHENERIWTPRGARIPGAPPWIHQ